VGVVAPKTNKQAIFSNSWQPPPLRKTVVLSAVKVNKSFLCLLLEDLEGVGIWPHFSFTSAVDFGEMSTLRPERLTARKKTAVPIEWEAGFAPEWIWIFWKRGKPHTPAGIRTANRISPDTCAFKSFMMLDVRFETLYSLHAWPNREGGKMRVFDYKYKEMIFGLT